MNTHFTFSDQVSNMGDAALDLSAKSSNVERNNSLSSMRDYHRNSVSSRRSSISSVTSELERDSPLGITIKQEDSFHDNSSRSPISVGDDDKASSSDKSFGGSRPFKVYPMERLQSYSPGTPSSPISPLGNGPVGLPGAYEQSQQFPSFPLTPLTSHLLQRKRRAENRAEILEPKKTKPVPEERKDDAYWERRRKNNEAAKRSRDTRRMKEEEIAMRAAFLEQENLKLRAQVAILKNETAKLHYMLYNRI